MFSDRVKNRLVKFKGSHALHFEKPVELADEIVGFMDKTSGRCVTAFHGLSSSAGAKLPSPFAGG